MPVKTKTFCAVFLFLLLTSAAISIWTEIVLYGSNVLLFNDHWSVDKCHKKIAVMGCDSYLVNRQSVANHMLWLHAFWGHQEVTWYQRITPQHVSFGFKLADDAYLHLMIKNENDALFTVRISRNNNFPTTAFTVTPTGELVAGSVVLSDVKLSAKWHIGKVNFAADQIQILIDDQLILQTQYPAWHDIALGFRGGLHGVNIDEINITDIANHRYHESFDNRAVWWQVAMFNAKIIMVFVLIIVVVLVLSIRSKQAFFLIYYWLLIVQISLIVCGMMWYGFDWFYWSRLPLETQTRPLLKKTTIKNPDKLLLFKIEDWRYRFFSAWYGVSLGYRAGSIVQQKMAQQTYLQNRNWDGPFICYGGNNCDAIPISELESVGKLTASSYSIMVIGASQIVGAGSSTLNDTFVVQTYKELARRMKNKRQLSLLNIA
jgi:hypothetical protein